MTPLAFLAAFLTPTTWGVLAALVGTVLLVAWMEWDRRSAFRQLCEQHQAHRADSFEDAWFRHVWGDESWGGCESCRHQRPCRQGQRLLDEHPWPHGRPGAA